MPFLAALHAGARRTDVGEVALWTGLTLGVTPASTRAVRPALGPRGRPIRQQDPGAALSRQLRRRHGTHGVCDAAMAPVRSARHSGTRCGLRSADDCDGGHVGAASSRWRARSAPCRRRSVWDRRSGLCSAECLPPRSACGTRFSCRRRVYAGAFLMVTLMYTGAARAQRKPGEGGRVSFASGSRLRELRAADAGDLRSAAGRSQLRSGLAAALTELGYSSVTRRVLVGMLFSVLAICAAASVTSWRPRC